MTPVMTAVHILVGLLLLTGLVGSVVPLLPGTLLILAGAFIYALATDFDPLGVGRLVILAALTALAYGIDYAAGAFGVRKLGGSGWAALGAMGGAVVGAFFGPLGLVVGPIIGAVVAELARSRNLGVGLRSGLGSVVGMILGTAAKLSIAVAMVALFLWWVWPA